MAGSAAPRWGATLVACAALTACGPTSPASDTQSGSGGSMTPPTSSSEPSGPTGSDSSSATSATTSSGSGGSASAAGRACANGDLSVAVGRSSVAAGHVGLALVFTNVSGSPCDLFGYPGVTGLDARGRQVVQGTRTTTGYLGGPYAVAKVVVPPGGTASALLEGTDVPTGAAGSCATYSALLVTPPAQTHSSALRNTFPGCSGIQVHPVVSGADGRS